MEVEGQAADDVDDHGEVRRQRHWRPDTCWKKTEATFKYERGFKKIWIEAQQVAAVKVQTMSQVPQVK